MSNMIFSLSQVQAHTTQHLTDHAAHWTDLAQRRTDVFSTVKNDAESLNWTGVGDAAMKATIARDHGTATGEAATLTAAAQAATNAATVLDGQKRAIINAVDQAKQNDFSVSDIWTVTDAKYKPGTPEWAVRQPVAQSIQATLLEQAAAFTAQEYATGTELSGHAVTLGGSPIGGSPKASMVDFKTDKGPAPSPSPVHPDLSAKNDQKKQCTFNDIFQGFTDVVGGTAVATGGAALVAAGGSTEALTGGASTPISLPGILTGLAGLAGGSESVVKGLDKLHDCE
jgi:hypothetical protein